MLAVFPRLWKMVFLAGAASGILAVDHVYGSVRDHDPGRVFHVQARMDAGARSVDFGMDCESPHSFRAYRTVGSKLRLLRRADHVRHIVSTVQALFLAAHFYAAIFSGCNYQDSRGLDTWIVFHCAANRPSDFWKRRSTFGYEPGHLYADNRMLVSVFTQLVSAAWGARLFHDISSVFGNIGRVSISDHCIFNADRTVCYFDS